MHERFHASPAFQTLQALRIPAGWLVEWNNLHTDHTIENGDFGGSSVWRASNAGRRFVIDVEFRPEHDPGGHFELTVDYYPYPRTEKGRRAKEERFEFRGECEEVARFETCDYRELVGQLEYWIATCSVWAREQS